MVHRVPGKGRQIPSDGSRGGDGGDVVPGNRRSAPEGERGELRRRALGIVAQGSLREGETGARRDLGGHRRQGIVSGARRGGGLGRPEQPSPENGEHQDDDHQGEADVSEGGPMGFHGAPHARSQYLRVGTAFNGIHGLSPGRREWIPPRRSVDDPEGLPGVDPRGVGKAYAILYDEECAKEVARSLVAAG